MKKYFRHINCILAILMIGLAFIFYIKFPGPSLTDRELFHTLFAIAGLIMMFWFINISLNSKQRSFISIAGIICSLIGIVAHMIKISTSYWDLYPGHPDFPVKQFSLSNLMLISSAIAMLLIICILCGKEKRNRTFKWALGFIIISSLLSLMLDSSLFAAAIMEFECPFDGDTNYRLGAITRSLYYISFGISMALCKDMEDPAPVQVDAPVPAPKEEDETEIGVQDKEVMHPAICNIGVLSNGSILQNGRYRIEGVLGQGGFGITYKAVQTGLNRKVAIKEFFMKEFCDRDATSNRITMGTEGSKELVEKFKNKFIKEAQVIADMQNDHIVRIYDVFEENNTAYYVMEYISGGNLAARISGTPTEENVAYGYVRQICDALKYLHERSILHLDIKPSNIMFRDNNELVLIDFGISKHYDKEEGSQTSSTPIGISRGYAPLEQYKPGGVSTFSPATDIYSVGATLYNMVTGQLPPEAEDVNEEGLEPFPCEVSEKFRNAIVKAMEPRRRMRPQSIDEFMNLFNS